MESAVSVPPELPYHSSTFYNGKILEPLSAVNEGQLRKIDCGVWSDTVPDQLRTIIQPHKYREAIAIINTVSRTKVRFKSYWPLLLIAMVITLVILFIFIGIPLLVKGTDWFNEHHPLTVMGVISLFSLKTFFNFWKLARREKRRVVRELGKAIGQANSLLLEEKILMGAQSNSKLFLVYACVDDCRQELYERSHDHELFDKGILDYSSAYTCCLTKGRFRFKPMSSACHLEGALCFCQYVICRQFREKCCFCCRKPDSYPALTPGEEINASVV